MTMTWPHGENILIYQTQSPHQSIQFYRCGKDFWLSLNNVLQFHTDECYRSHKYMIHAPVQMFMSRTKRVPQTALIIGGGDGFAAREFFEILPNIKLTQVELDASLLNFSKYHPTMKKLNNGAFHNSNLNLMSGDGISYLINSPQTFDIIIDDCDVEVTNQPIAFQQRYLQYQKALINKLNLGGIACIMEPLVPITPNSYKLVPRDPVKRRQWIKKRVIENEDLREWRKRIGGTRYAVADLPHIGPELYIYMPKP